MFVVPTDKKITIIKKYNIYWLYTFVLNNLYYTYNIDPVSVSLFILGLLY